MLQLDPCTTTRFRNEPHIDLAGFRRIGLELPRRSDVPREDDARGRVVGEDTRPSALAAVNADVVNMPALARLKDGLGDGNRQQIVFAWLDGIELINEKRECSLDTEY